MGHKLVKVGAGILLALIILFALAIFFISRMDPNEYKPQIQQLVQDQMGADLQIKNISWQFWPSLKLNLEGVELASQEKQHSQLLQVEQADVEVAVMPLLQRKVVVDHLTLKKPSVWFHQYPDGSSNWQPLLDRLASETPPAEPAQESQAAPITIAADRVDLIDGMIKVSGETQATVQPLNLELKNIQFGAPMDVVLQAGIAGLGQKLKVKTNAAVTLTEDMPQLTLDNFSTSLTGPQSDQTATISGSAKVNLETLASTIDLVVEPVNADAWLATLPESTPDKSQNKPSDVTASDAAPTPIPREMLQQLQLNGKLHLKEVVYKSSPHSLAMEVKANNGLINLNKFEAQAYEGTAKGMMELNAKANPTAMDLKLDVSQMSMAAILQTWLNVQPVAGIFEAAVDVQTTGNTVEALIDGIKGATSVNMADAVLPKVNLHELLWSNLQSKQGTLVQMFSEFPKLKEEMGTLKTPKILREQTQLDDILAQMTITPQMIQSQQLTATLNDQPISGQFTYGRQSQSLLFKTALQLPFKNNELANIVWPLSCKAGLTGGFGCSVDTQALKPVLTKLAKDEAKSKLKQELRNELAPQEDKAKQQLREAEDKAKAKIEESLGRDLKGLFK